MGLDITAYSKIKFIEVLPSAEAWEDKYYMQDNDTNTFWIWPGHVENPDFPQQIEGADLVPGGVYSYEDSYSFRAGSYSGYNQWREWLCASFTYAIPQNVWKSPVRFQNRHFFLLVNFSDCEGLIAGPSAARLLEEFEAHKDEALKRPVDDTWMLERYNDWLKAFRLAADGGLVHFH